MNQPAPDPVTMESLFLWVMHRFAEAFSDHAILKGGMALRIIDCPRSTTDLDYVFVPYGSKKEIREPIKELLSTLEAAKVEVRLHSKMLRAIVTLEDTSIQIEVSVALACPTIAMATGGFATSQGRPSQVVRIMALDHALAHKLAAWNERRLLRDLYDAYFLGVRVGERPDLAVLTKRLEQVHSSIPALASRRQMSLLQLAEALQEARADLSQARIDAELGPLLPEAELAGLLVRLRGAIQVLTDAIT